MLPALRGLTVDGVRQSFEEPGQDLVEVVIHLVNNGLREGNRDLQAVDTDAITRVVALDEMAGSPDRDLIEDVEQPIRGELVGIERHRLSEVIAEAGDPCRRKRSIVLEEVAQEVIEVSEAVVRWC